MTFEMAFTIGVLVASMALFVSDRVRLDIVALGAMLALTLAGILPAKQAVAGFSDPVIVTLAALFVVGEGLAVTGVADRLGAAIVRVAGAGEVRLLVACMLAAALLSAFMSSTGAVAMLMPVVLGIAVKSSVSPSKLMMPLAFATLLGGMLTLVGTPPNLVVSSALQQAERPPFAFFSFTPLGLVILAAGVLFMATFGRRLLPAARGAAGPHAEAVAGSRGGATADELAAAYGLPGSVFRLRVPRHAALAGQRIGEAGLRSRYRVTVLDVQALSDAARGADPSAGAEVDAGADPAEAARAKGVTPETAIAPGSVLVVQGAAEHVAAFAKAQGLDVLPGQADGDALIEGALGMAEVVLTPRSRLVGQTLADARFRELYRVHVLGILRLGAPLAGELHRHPLKAGDALLVQGTWEQIRLLRQERTNLVVVGEPRELAERELGERTRRAPVAIAITLAMLLAMSLEVIPSVTAALLAALAMVLTRCLTMERAYQSISWQGIVLIAGMLPLAAALEKTGGLALAVDALLRVLGDAGPHAVIAGLFLVTSSLSLVMSNTATSVILAPVALEAAEALEVAPQAFLMTVALAASTAFATPVASPVNTLVLGAGGYRFADFVKVGLPLQLIVMGVTVALVGVFFPL